MQTEQVDILMANITEYMHYQFHVPELKADRRLYTLLGKVRDFGRADFTFKNADAIEVNPDTSTQLASQKLCEF